MRKIFARTFITFNVLTLIIAVLILAGCGSGGGEMSSPVQNLTQNLTQTTTATTGPPVSKELTLTWDPVADATSYNLYWSNGPDISPLNGTKIAGISSLSYVHTGLASGTTYYYVVTATDGNSESSASISTSGTTTL